MRTLNEIIYPLSSIFLLILLSENLFAQKDLSISGGNMVSSTVCSNRRAYVWGNINGTVVTTPTIVHVGNPEVDIKQISSGSGATFLALDCNNNVWSWGNNKFGQVGNGTTASRVTVPERVLASPIINSTNRDADNYLTNVAVVYSGNNNSFAILQDRTLVAWGHNSSSNATAAYDQNDGQLGDGTLTDRFSAVYVMDCSTGQPLQGVTEVYAGDNVAYALTDPDGDGVGTVYSWGNGLNGVLGRNIAGTGNPASGTTVQSSCAAPVYYTDGTPLNNITEISAGDVFGIALDVNNYIWTWGNGGWNNSTGNTTINYTGSDPRRVIKGNTTGASNDGTYLLAKAIGGGQGFGMAVTIDGKPVSWGGGNACNAGGIQGTGKTAINLGPPPTYILNGSTGKVDSNVIAIDRGDTWGFYATSDNRFYAWGCNVNGQLGIGNTNDQFSAQSFIPPNGCDLSDPEPTASITPGDTSLCQADLQAGITLNSGFVIAPELAPSYVVRWYRNGVLLVWGDASTDVTYIVKDTGTYTVDVNYNGANGGCGMFDTAHASMHLSYDPGCTITSTSPARATSGLNLYPNPAEDVAVLEAPSPGEFSLTNLAGETMYTGKADNAGPVNVNVSGLEPGLYLIEFVSGDKVYRSRFFKR